MQKMPYRIDRRAFLSGLGGVSLALPVLNSHRVTDLLPHGEGRVELHVEAEGRGTAVLEKRGNRWLVVQLHTSGRRKSP